MNILVVDDSRIMRNIVKNALNKSNISEFHVLEASNGLDAWQLIQSKSIDLLLLDWNMPKLNGLDLVKRLRDSVQFKTLPVIMITSEAAKYNVIEAVKAGVNDYIIKPLSEESLLTKIDQLMARQQ